MGNPYGEDKSHGEYSLDLWGTPWESLVIPHWTPPWEKIPVGILETRPVGRAQLSHGRFLIDPGIFAWVEQALDMAANCSIPCPRFDLGIFGWVESQA